MSHFLNFKFKNTLYFESKNQVKICTSTPRCSTPRCFYSTMFYSAMFYSAMFYSAMFYSATRDFPPVSHNDCIYAVRRLGAWTDMPCYAIFIHFHSFSFISIHFHSFSFISIHFHSFSFIFIHFLSKKIFFPRFPYQFSFFSFF